MNFKKAFLLFGAVIVIINLLLPHGNYVLFSNDGPLGTLANNQQSIGMLWSDSNWIGSVSLGYGLGVSGFFSLIGGIIPYLWWLFILTFSSLVFYKGSWEVLERRVRLSYFFLAGIWFGIALFCIIVVRSYESIAYCISAGCFVFFIGIMAYGFTNIE